MKCVWCKSDMESQIVLGIYRSFSKEDYIPLILDILLIHERHVEVNSTFPFTL